MPWNATLLLERLAFILHGKLMDLLRFYRLQSQPNLLRGRMLRRAPDLHERTLFSLE